MLLCLTFGVVMSLSLMHISILGKIYLWYGQKDTLTALIGWMWMCKLETVLECGISLLQWLLNPFTNAVLSWNDIWHEEWLISWGSYARFCFHIVSKLYLCEGLFQTWCTNNKLYPLLCPDQTFSSLFSLDEETFFFLNNEVLYIQCTHEFSVQIWS